jgi:NADP-dependent 3-hydroxy acid dehydrogenase YdfG
VPNTPQTILITGCSSGIGHACAERLQGKGHTVYATARRPKSLEDLRARGCRTLALDVTDEDSMSEAVRAVEEAEGAVDVLVNNAGYSQSGAVESIPLDEIRAQFETNVFGLIRMSQLVLPKMRERGRGRIVNVGSMGGKLTFPGGGIYHASKYAVEAISDAMRFELGGFGIQVVLLEPGLITTEFPTTAVGSIARDDDGPYARFNRAVGAVTAGAYKGPLRHLGAGPGAVARVVERAVNASRPRARYTVTASARLMLAQRALLPDALWDRMVASSFPRPGA